jgi:hypothetical protein
MNERLWNLFGPNQALSLFIVILAIDLPLTFFHSLQELQGKFWRYFGFIAGVEIPDRFGRIVFLAVDVHALVGGRFRDRRGRAVANGSSARTSRLPDRLPSL